MITGKDISTMMDLLVAAYGDKSFPSEPKQMAQVANLWSVMFRDDEPEEVLLAVKNCIATLSFPPKVADIKSRIAQSRMAGRMTEMEAWIQIRKAVKSAGTNAEANDAFDKLPAILKILIGDPSTLMVWKRISNDTFEGVISSNFMRSYRETVKNEAMYNALPKDMQSSQSYLNPMPKEVTMLPEPAPQKSLDEMEANRIRSEIEYREKYLSDELRASNEKVEKFKNPTDAEMKMIEAKNRHKDEVRVNSWNLQKSGRKS